MNKDKLKRVLRYILKGIPQVIIKADIHYTSPSSKLSGKKIIVTGGGKGLGYAMAKRFAEEGAKVLITGRNESILEESAAKITCAYLRLDMQDTESFSSFMKEADKLLGGNINCLVNNAGISLHEDGFLAVSSKQFDDQFSTNLKGPFFLTQVFMEYCAKEKSQGVKHILFTSSETSMTVDERPYGLTKTALNSLIQGLAHRYVNEGYRINAVAPGVTISDMVGKKDRENLALDCNMTGRYYLPEEVAEVASFLLSDASNCLNGQILVCNEGKTINARWK
ncbi:MAG: SDR family oxidoreductase [Prevotella sp.]|nr:SDR family oxidoreductase [Prevotella sp.]